MKIIKEEEQIQRAVVYWLRKTFPATLHTISPITKLSVSLGARMKAMGYSKGSPDLMVFQPRAGYHGLFIEFKTPKGKINIDQYHWAKELQALGYYHAFCRSADEAITILQKYLTSNH